MNKYKVLISPQAYEELEVIYKYIALSLPSPAAANSTLEAIKNTILSLDEMPNRGAIRKVGIYANMGYRQLFVKNYTVIYRIDEKDKIVIIITVRYTPSAF
ncbi:type II toxin-antitoxin system RelE/ParE family toxin [Campylobacter concisus]